ASTWKVAAETCAPGVGIAAPSPDETLKVELRKAASAEKLCRFRDQYSNSSSQVAATPDEAGSQYRMARTRLSASPGSGASRERARCEGASPMGMPTAS